MCSVINPYSEHFNSNYFDGLYKIDLKKVQVLRNGEVALIGSKDFWPIIYIYEKDIYNKEKHAFVSDERHDDYTCFIQLSNGDYVSGFDNDTIIINDALTGNKKMRILKEYNDDDDFDCYSDEEGVLALIELPNGYLVSSYTDNSVVIRDISQNEPKLINMFRLKADSFILLPNGNDLACFSNDSISFISFQNEFGFCFQRKFFINKTTNLFNIRSPFLLPNNDLVFVHEKDKICTIDINRQRIKSTVSYGSEIKNAVLLPNGYLAWTSNDNTKLMIGSINEKHIYHEIKPFDHEIKSLTLLLDGNLITISERKHIVLWKIDYTTV